MTPRNRPAINQHRIFHVYLHYAQHGSKAFENMLLGQSSIIMVVPSFSLSSQSMSEYSIQLNASRIKVLQAQDDLVSAMREAASKDLFKTQMNRLTREPAAGPV